MYHSSPWPKEPCFIFDKKMWMISNEYEIYKNGFSVTKVIFEHNRDVFMIDPEVGFNGDSSGYWDSKEVVEIKIDNEYAEPAISMFESNSGKRVSDGDIDACRPIFVPLFVIEKLVKEAIKIDVKNRDNAIENNPILRKVIKDDSDEALE